MSFGYAVGDVIAVLGLFERIAIELRNYKDAPMHFQQLRAELDLVHSTLKHVLALEPNCTEELQTLEQIRAIVIHCSQPLQAMVNKMRSKESSLGHFRSTRCLSAIGERLHWSMIAQGDIDSVRKTIMSQMAAVNILLSVQQLTRVKHLSLQSKRIGADQSLVIEKHANAIAGHASNILKIASRTQEAVNTLTINAAIQDDIRSKQRDEINKSLTGIETNMVQLTQKTERASAMVRRHAGFVTRHVKMLYSLMKDLKKLFNFLTNFSKEMLEAISKNTRALLDLSGKLKHIIKAIEAIPLHLTLDIVRLDDAHGESWALPLQACQTWESFCDLLRCVVYANDRPGADHIIKRLFAVTHAKTGRQIGESAWARFVKPGFHIEQAMVVERVRSLETCPDSTCIGRLVEQVLEYGRRQACDTCGRCVTTSRAPSPMLFLYGQDDAPTALSNSSGYIRDTKTKVGPELPSIDVKDKLDSFRRVQVVHPTEPVRDIGDAFDRLHEDLDQPEANAFIGLDDLRLAEDEQDKSSAEDSIYHLGIAIQSDSGNAEYWYLFGRAHMQLENHMKSYECFQRAIFIQSRSPTIWITVGILYFQVNQYRDCLDAIHRALRLNAYIYEAWYNLGVLYDSCANPHDDSTYAFERCEELRPGLPEVDARLRAYRAYVQDSNEELFRQHLIHDMIETPLLTHYEMDDGTQSEDITLNPVRDAGVQESEDSEKSSNSI